MMSSRRIDGRAKSGRVGRTPRGLGCSAQQAGGADDQHSSSPLACEPMRAVIWRRSQVPNGGGRSRVTTTAARSRVACAAFSLRRRRTRAPPTATHRLLFFKRMMYDESQEACAPGKASCAAAWQHLQPVPPNQCAQQLQSRLRNRQRKSGSACSLLITRPRRHLRRCSSPAPIRQPQP